MFNFDNSQQYNQQWRYWLFGLSHILEATLIGIMHYDHRDT